MTFTSFIIRTVTRHAARRFDRAAANPVEAQTRWLLKRLAVNANTEYGKRYGFASIRTLEDYAKAVPVVGYEDISADMRRVTEGARDVFTAEDPLMFAQTSGTTGNPKFIPVTPTCQGKEHQDVSRTWLYHLQATHGDMFGGKIVSLVSPAVEGHTPCGKPYGSTSGEMYQKMPRMVRGCYAIPYEVFEIADYQAKYYAIMRIALNERVRAIVTANPSSILKMCEKANEHGERIIEDIHNGTLSREMQIEPEIRAVVERRLRKDPERARFLEEMRRKRNGRLLPADYWQEFRVVGCWKGGTVGRYVEKFPEWFDPDGTRRLPVRDLGYLASELRGSVPLSDDGSKGVLTVGSNYFEFVDMAELEAKPKEPSAWTFRHVGQLEQGHSYYLFATTTGGLYRYDINDVIQVVGKYLDTPEIVFLRKGRGMTNLTGEKVSVNQVIDSFHEAAKETGTEPEHFKAEADPSASRYVFRVEFARPVNSERQGAFLVSVDRCLRRINLEYEAKRKSLRLNDPVLHVMREGWYERSRKAQAAAGKRVFQSKTEVLSAVKLATMAVQNELENVVEMSGQKQND